MQRLTLACLATTMALCAAGSAAAQVSVELLRVPEQVTGPLGAGRNLIVTAAVRGQKVTDVWLAAKRGDAERAALIHTGSNRWQINLATGDAADLLRRHGRGTVAVFARTANDRVVWSVPIQFEIRAAAPGRRTELTHVYATVDGKRRRYYATDNEELWLVPEAVSKLDVRVSGGERSHIVLASVDDHSWRFVFDSNDRMATLRVTDDMAGSWRRGGVLTVRMGDDFRIRLRAIPRRLAPGDRYLFTVHQRNDLELPGSDRQLKIALGDITRGQVKVEIRTAKDWRELAARPLREGDKLKFEHRDQRYVLELVRLVNHLIGEDHARFEVWRPADGESNSSRK